MKFLSLLSCVLWCSLSDLLGQSLEYAHSSVPVTGRSGTLLTNPFAGGINSGQFGHIDLDGDGTHDLMVFDRTSDKVSTFLKRGNNYEFAPQYECYFPQPLFNWVILADYDGDGRKDLFTSTNLGIKVYKNVTIAAQPLAWQLVADPIFTQGISLINLFVNSTDLPAIRDIDGDGDLDIMVFNFASGGFVEFHKNVSVERFGNRNTLAYERVSREWGDFRECFCGEFAYGGAECTTFGRIEHVAGKAITLVDITGDGNLDILFGEELCADLFLLENTSGTPNAIFRNGKPSFDVISNAMNFPAAYEVDVNGDGINELIVSPNDRRNELDFQNFTKSVYLFEKTGDRFELKAPDFLQNTMIEVGEGSAPLLADVDGDGLTDLLIANRGAKMNARFVASLTYYQNRGTSFQPALAFQTDDFLNLSSLRLLHIKPKMIDFTRDGRPDLVFSGFDGQRTRLYVVPATNAGFSVDGMVNFPLSINQLDNIEFSDINRDGLLDLIAGTSSGRLDLYYNVGTTIAPQFQLQTAGYLGVSTNPSRTNLAVASFDLDQSGSEDLLLYDDSGELRIAFDYTTDVSELTTIALAQCGQNVQLGRLGTLTVGRLFDDERMSVMFGSAQGGVFHFTYATGPDPCDEWKTSLFPNPTFTHTISLLSNKPAIGSVYAISGQTVLAEFSVAAQKKLTLPTTHFAAGMYIMRLKSEDGSYRNLKFIVNE